MGKKIAEMDKDEIKNRRDLEKQSSMFNWYPRVQELPLRTPETKMLEVEFQDTEDDYYNPDCPIVTDEEYMDKIVDTIEKLGGPPIFLRTDMASYKHKMNGGSRIDTLEKEEIYHNIYEVVCFNEIAGMAGMPYKGLVLREWLELDHKFKSFQGTPIAQEIRFFVENGEVLCKHFYWAKDSLDFRLSENRPSNWPELWEETKEETLENVEKYRLSEDASTVSREFNGFWSVDFAKTVTDDWYLIDMARGEISWHPKDCEHNPRSD